MKHATFPQRSESVCGVAVVRDPHYGHLLKNAVILRTPWIHWVLGEPLPTCKRCLATEVYRDWYQQYVAEKESA